jgi:hypothetical protein
MSVSYPLECSSDSKHTEAWGLSEICQFCPVCGAGLVLKLKACCKRWSVQSANYCGECGKPLKENVITNELDSGTIEINNKKTSKNGGKK